ncbi:copper chaperone [Amphibacillus marinus]|uniref:Copper chaperone n=1 Tax=Amphibacillus marinus TaxID=872970 RepID=A0A1H8RWQ1_9BACI|nr:cation transporter [Amphibacillus marinus]SEO70881.1 copper chaperone [Amphibacillus marinus]
MNDLKLEVVGMSCGHCKKAIEAALTEHAAVESAEVSLAEHTVAISYQEAAISIAELKTIIEEQGYQVQS